MVVNFANFDFTERPLLILKNASGSAIGVLGYAQSIVIDLKYNETSTIEFDLPANADGNAVPFYDDVIGMRIVELKGIGQFTLVNPKETGDGVKKIKSCKGYSLEYEFAYKKLTLANGTYNFYDAVDNTNTLMGIILEKIPSWSIGSIDDTLVGKYRTFEVSNENLYNFIKGTVQESYNCIFDFDTMKRQVNVIDASSAVGKVPVFISTGNLATEIDVEEETEDIVTRLDVNGADGVTIRDVNPCGTNKIIDLSYFMNTANFSQDLIDKYNAWQNVVKSNRQTYYSTSIEYTMQTMGKVAQEAKLTDLKGELTNLENVQAVVIQAIAQNLKTQIDLDAANADIAAKKEEIAAKEAEIEEIGNELSSLMVQLQTIRNTCSFEKYFTEDELLQLDKYIKDDEISESSFVAVETDTYANESVGTELPATTAISVLDSNVTMVTNTFGKDIYSMSGGTLTIGSLINATIISAVVDFKSDNSYVMTAYLSSGTYSNNSFANACISIVGDASNITNDTATDETGLNVGTTVSFTADTGYFYFTFDTSEFQKRSVAWELFEYGEEVLAKLAQPSYTFNVTSANFFSGEDFALFRNKIALGKKVYVEVKEGTVLQPICIGVKLEYEDPASLELEFSDTYTSSDSTFKLVDLLDKSVSMGKNLDASKYVYSAFEDSGAETGIRTFMKSALDVSKNAIISSSGQAITWDGAGLRLRKKVDGKDAEYELEQIWMNNNCITMTADGWQTAQMAIGKFHDDNLGDCWGIVAPRIVGTLLAGQELVIESSKQDGSGVSLFRVDENGVRLHNGDIAINKGNSQIVLNPDVGIAIGEYPVVQTVDDVEEIDPDKAKFWVDSDGNLNFKGILKGASGEFEGTIKATKLEIVSSSSETQTIDQYVDDRATTKATEIVDGVQVGGRNLLLNDYIAVGKGTSTSEMEIVSVYGEEYMNHENFVKVFTAGTEYTFSYDWEITGGSASSVGYQVQKTGFVIDSATASSTMPNVDVYAANATVGVNTSGHVNKTFILNSVPDDAHILIYTNKRTDKSSDSVRFSNIKIEKGNKETDWTPAPEDVQKMTDEVSELAKNAQDAADKAQSAADKAQETANGGVAQVLVQYAVGDSETEAPTSGWSPAMPSKSSGQYVWQKTTTTYNSGDTSESSPTCISGANGEDATVLRIDSSKGTVFKNNAVSTVLTVAVYHGGTRITDATTLRNVYGSSARIQWEWLRLTDEKFGIISSSDSRISDEGFTFTLSPDDVDVKVTFMCELIID